MRYDSIEIDESLPFKNDLLSRKESVNNLLKIINMSSNDLVINVDSSWGTGKTTFVKMFIAYLKNNEKCKKNYETLYFNAWENDDSSDPLIAIIHEMISDLSCNRKNEKFEKIKNTGKNLFKKALPYALRIATRNALDIEDIKLSSFTEEQITELVSSYGEIELENHKQVKESKERFKRALVEYQNDIGKKIIFFVDELDRCRPTYAIETLERIKHLFNVENYVFVLSTDLNQLSHCVKVLYGSNINSTGYLRRFIDIEYILPEPEKNEYISSLFEKLFTNCPKLENDNISNVFKPLIIWISGNINLSLRDLNKLFCYFEVLLPLTELTNDDLDEEWKQIYSIIYIIFPILKLEKSNLYDKFNKRDKIEENQLRYIYVNKVYLEVISYKYLGIVNEIDNIINNIFILNHLYLDFDKSSIDKLKENPKFRYGIKDIPLHYLFDEQKKKFKPLEKINLIKLY